MFCEQCGAELEQNARFCGMCAMQVANEGAHTSGQGVLHGVAGRRVSLLQVGLIAALFGVLILAGALWWMGGAENADVNATSQSNSSDARVRELESEVKALKAQLADRSDSSPATNVRKDVPDFSTTAFELCNELILGNRAAFELKYIGKTIRVTGEIRVARASEAQIKACAMKVFVCEFDPSDSAAFASLPAQSTLRSVVGTYDGEQQGEFRLRHCAIQN